MMGNYNYINDLYQYGKCEMPLQMPLQGMLQYASIPTFMRSLRLVEAECALSSV
jgi:hypothetical protein